MNVQNNTTKSDFKIIALKTIKGCREDFLKILKPDETYYFYNNYSISPTDDKIINRSKLPVDFFGASSPSINISAIVGKNGSGKSTIIELLFRIINNIAAKQRPNTAKLEYTEGLFAALYYYTDNYYKIEVRDREVEQWTYNKNGTRQYEPEVKFRFEEFFYSIVVNYSHFAYNVNDLGSEVNWLDGLFHKNEGYQTPLVINPKRTEGNIDINKENLLVKSRLIANFFLPARNKRNRFRHLTDKLQATSLQLTLNESKADKVLYEIPDEKNNNIREVTLRDLDPQRELILTKLNQIYPFDYNKPDAKKYKLAFDYIVYKLVSICLKYVEYRGFYNKVSVRFNVKALEKFLSDIIEDESHITFKLKQTLNFLKFKHLELNDQIIDLDEFTTTISSLSKKFKKGTSDIIEMIPPPIFKVNIILKTKDEKNKTVSFGHLSSGEKQMIYSVSSILYHLANLDSIRGTKTRRAYKFVNIILEEIELYFHPEMQRAYINSIIDNLSWLKFKRIKGLNFCFVTHSPFILSDIPDSNILFLNEDGFPIKNQKKIKTFGGNIHDLLAHSFFLNNGFIGEFAKDKIQAVINQLAKGSNEAYFTEVEIFEIIQFIGEPFLREKLMEMYYVKYAKKKRIEDLKAELKRLEND